MRLALLFLLVTIFVDSLKAQEDWQVELCNSFDSASINLRADSNSIWEIGQPSKPIISGSYSDTGSIVTALSDSLVPLGDTSYFTIMYTHEEGYIKEQFGAVQPLRISFYHRFETDVSDYGKIELMMNDSNHWFSVYNNQIGKYLEGYRHTFESGEILHDTLEINGSSNGWIHTELILGIQTLRYILNIDTLDSVSVRFSFLSDSVGLGSEGWQIDDLCISMGFVNGIEKLAYSKAFDVYPNPSTELFNLPAEISQNSNLEVYDIHGKMVMNTPVNQQVIYHQLPAGMYFLIVHQKGNFYRSKLIVQ